MLYRTLKRMIERSQTNGLEEKIDIFFAAGLVRQNGCSGIGMAGRHVAEGGFAGAHQFDPLADGLAAVGEHSQRAAGEDRIRPQGVVLESHTPAVAQEPPGGGTHLAVGQGIPEGGALQELRNRDDLVAVVAEQLQLLAQTVGNGGAAGHVVAVLLEDNLSPRGCWCACSRRS